MLRLFVTGTDTGVGKTEAACAVLSLLADAGARPAPFKPYESGCADLRRPGDAVALRAAARSRDALGRICVHRFRAPLAPAIAAMRATAAVPWGPVVKAFRSFRGRSLVAEGAGGLRVPLDGKRDQLDLIVALDLPVLLVARAGLGTLNHSALSLDALAARGARVLGVLLVETRANARDPSVADNPGWLARRYRLPVLGPVPFQSRGPARRQAFREESCGPG